MFSSDLAFANLLSPAVLCFVLGALAVLLRSDLALPESIFSGLSIFLMLSIGLRGGAELAERHLSDISGPVAAALLLGCSIPIWCYALLRRFGGLSIADAAALSAHYGSVSAVTFAAVTALLDRQGVAYEGYASASWLSWKRRPSSWRWASPVWRRRALSRPVPRSRSAGRLGCSCRA